MTADRPVLGIALMLIFCILAPLGDSIAKLLGGIVPLLQLLLVRFAIQAFFLAPIVMLTDRTFAMSKRVLLLTIARTVLHVVGVGTMFLALRFMPLADAIAIAFVMPFIMLLLGKYVLHEEVGSRRLMACIVGFIGTLMVIQPSFAEVGAPALLPLAVAVIFALFLLVTRQIAKDVDPISMQSVSGFIATAVLLLIFVLASGQGWQEFSWIEPDTKTWLMLLVLGIMGSIAHLFMTWSLRYAPASTLAPMQYLEIPIATLIGFLIFADLPNGLAAIGIIITIGAGLYVVYREHVTSKEAEQVS